MVRTRLQHTRALAKRWHAPITVIGVLIVLAALVIAIAGDAGKFSEAMSAAPLWILGIAALLQIFWLLARTESWHVCVTAAGGTVGRTRLYRASSLGYLGGLFNGAFGLGVRIAALRRSAPEESPRVPTLVAAEMPIVVVEVMLAALMSFTLVAPLGLPWWVPIVGVAVTGAALWGLSSVARHRERGFWKGLAVLRELDDRKRIVALVILAVCAQVARNWLLLQASGVDASVLDSVAVLIAIAAIGILPFGPSTAAAATVLILGAGGVAATAAAGVLLTVSAAVGSLCFAAWALASKFWPPARARELALAPGG